MSDTYTLHMENFRSIRDATVEIAPMTVIYGANGTGKSSLIYGLLTLRNFFTNPAQNVPSLFSYPTISLGGLREVVRNHVEDAEVSLSLRVRDKYWSSVVMLSVGQSGGVVGVVFDYPHSLDPSARMSLDIPFPYHGDQQTSGSYILTWAPPSDESIEAPVEITWNGINLGMGQSGHITDRELLEWVLTIANSPVELARGIGFVPLRRGFGTPVYGVSNVTPSLATDTEVASLLATDRYLEYDVSNCLETIADRQVRARMQVGTSSFNLDSIPRNGGVPASMVNEGFGINQLVHMLTVCLYSKTKIVAIEEPEIHLHPSMVRKLVHAMVDITSKHDKRIIVSTHSETFVLSLLTQIAAGKIGVDDVSFIFAEKEDGESTFTKQEATRDGQIQGGLRSFIEAELEDMAVLFGQSVELPTLTCAFGRAG